MDNNLIEKYKNDLMRLYNARASTRAVPLSAPAENVSRADSAPQSSQSRMTAAELQSRQAGAPQSTALRGTVLPPFNSTGQSTLPASPPSQPPPQTAAPPRGDTLTDTGRLIAIVTTLRGLYPVPGARVTVFTGKPEQMNIIDSAVTDQSGRSKTFELPAPPRGISLDSESTELPYSLYNLMVEADGYADNIHLNIPIFRGVTSLQKSDMMLLSVADGQGPFVYDEAMRYTL